MGVKLIWNTPDPEFQIVRVRRFQDGTMGETDSTWQQSGLESGPDGKMRMSYPVFSVNLGPKDSELLTNLLQKSIYNYELECSQAAFELSGFSENSVEILETCFSNMLFVSKDQKSVQVCQSFYDYSHDLNYYHKHEDQQLELKFVDDKDVHKCMLSLTKELYKLAPIVFDKFKDVVNKC